MANEFVQYRNDLYARAAFEDGEHFDLCEDLDHDWPEDDLCPCCDDCPDCDCDER